MKFKLFRLICSLVSLWCWVTSSISFRLRLHNGRLIRVNLDDHGTFADLDRLIERSGHYLNRSTDILTVNHVDIDGVSLGNNSTLLKDSSMKNGDIVTIRTLQKTQSMPYSVDSLQERRINSNKKINVRKKNLNKLKDIVELRSNMVQLRTTNAVPNLSVSVNIDKIHHILHRITFTDFNHSAQNSSRNGGALLLGCVNYINQKRVVNVVGAIEFSSGSSSAQDNIVMQFIISKTMKMAKLLGLRVVGCAIGSLSHVQHAKNANSSIWERHHLQMALYVHKSCSLDRNDEFIALSVSPHEHLNRSIYVEAFRLHDEAFELHDRGMIITDSLYSPELRLTGPVLVSNAQEVQVLDCLLLVSPLAINRSIMDTACPQPLFIDHNFPSLLEMQEYPERAERARAYLSKLLTRIIRAAPSLSYSSVSPVQDEISSATFSAHRELQRLRDPHLLLFIDTQLENSSSSSMASQETPFTVLCRFLRDHQVRSHYDHNSIPTEVLITLDALRKSLL